MATVAIIQARMGSTRLPGKVMKPLAGKPALFHVMERASHCSLVDFVVIATSDQSQDDVIANYCQEESVACFRGSETDVLDRYYQTAKQFKAETVVRITSDCPVIDPVVAEKVVRTYQQSGCDYCSNIIERSYPIGLDTEVMSFAALERAWKEATADDHREHVTPYLSDQPRLFKHATVIYEQDLSDKRWTLDYPEDLAFLEAVYDELYQSRAMFLMQDILELLQRRPELESINASVGK